jgi:hypothetical protein
LIRAATVDVDFKFPTMPGLGRGCNLQTVLAAHGEHSPALRYLRIRAHNLSAIRNERPTDHCDQGRCFHGRAMTDVARVRLADVDFATAALKTEMISIELFGMPIEEPSR